MSTVGGIGIGLLILLLLWIGTLVIFVLGVKLQSNVSWFTLASTTIVTVILLIIPTDTGLVQEIDVTERDYSIIFKNLLLVILLMSSLVGFITFSVIHCLDSIHPKPIKSFGKE